MLSPLALFITTYNQPLRLNAHCIFGTGIEVLRAMKSIVDASGSRRSEPYLTQSVSVKNKIIPRLG